MKNVFLFCEILLRFCADFLLRSLSIKSLVKFLCEHLFISESEFPLDLYWVFPLPFVCYLWKQWQIYIFGPWCLNCFGAPQPLQWKLINRLTISHINNYGYFASTTQLIEIGVVPLVTTNFFLYWLLWQVFLSPMCLIWIDWLVHIFTFQTT